MKTKYKTPSDDSSCIHLNVSVTVTDYQSEEIRFISGRSQLHETCVQWDVWTALTLATFIN